MQLKQQRGTTNSQKNEYGNNEEKNKYLIITKQLMIMFVMSEQQLIYHLLEKNLNMCYIPTTKVYTESHYTRSYLDMSVANLR